MAENAKDQLVTVVLSSSRGCARIYVRGEDCLSEIADILMMLRGSDLTITAFAKGCWDGEQDLHFHTERAEIVSCT